MMKSAVRQRMRVRRRSLTADEKARAAEDVCSQALTRSDIAAALRTGVLAVYLASPDEIDLTACIEGHLARQVTVVAPRWNGTAYELARLKSLRDEDVRKGPMSILEPKEADLVRPQDVAVWLVPGLAFTRDGRRLGYGGGWYDRLMAEASPASLKLGVAHVFQVVEDLPTEPHDIRLSGILVGGCE